MDVRPGSDPVGSSGGRSAFRLGAVAMALGLAAFLAAWFLWGNRPSGAGVTANAPARGTPVAVDRPSSPFTRPLLMGRGSLDLARYEGNVVVLNFWASTCAPCRQEVPELERLWNTYRRQGVRFVGIDYQDGRAAATRFAQAHGMTYPSVIDANGSVGDRYGIFGLPTTYIIAPDGRIRYAIYGRIRTASFRSALQDVAGLTGTGNG